MGMKKYILSLLFITMHITLVNAQQNIKINVICDDANKEVLTMTLSSDRLNVSLDAVLDNTGGYVDIPEDRYYLKTNTKVYYLNGLVDNFNNMNQFSSSIDNNQKKFITLKELYSLKNNKDLTFIQKIVLQKNNPLNSTKTNTTTNTLDVYFDENSFTKAYKKCQPQISKANKNIYLQVGLIILLIFGILYLVYKKYKK